MIVAYPEGNTCPWCKRNGLNSRIDVDPVRMTCRVQTDCDECGKHKTIEFKDGKEVIIPHTPHQMAMPFMPPPELMPVPDIEEDLFLDEEDDTDDNQN